LFVVDKQYCYLFDNKQVIVMKAQEHIATVIGAHLTGVWND
jgi:hypothetical protein